MSPDEALKFADSSGNLKDLVFLEVPKMQPPDVESSKLMEPIGLLPSITNPPARPCITADGQRPPDRLGCSSDRGNPLEGEPEDAESQLRRKRARRRGEGEDRKII